MSRQPADDEVTSYNPGAGHSQTDGPFEDFFIAQKQEGELCVNPSDQLSSEMKARVLQLLFEPPVDAASIDACRTDGKLQAADVWHMLAVDPVSSMLDESCFRRLCEGVSYETIVNLLEHWAGEWWPIAAGAFSASQMSELAMERDSWMLIGQSGVLPVGRDAILNHPDIGITGLDGAERFADAFAPFNGNLYAMVILRGHFRRTTCDAFCLAHGDSGEGTSGHNDELDEFDYWTASGDVRYFISGDPEVDNLTTWREQVQAWWRCMAGIRLQLRGRPKGTTRFRIEDVVRLIDQYFSSLPDGDTASRAAFLEFSGIPLSSWNRYTKRWATTWTTLSNNHRRN